MSDVEIEIIGTEVQGLMFVFAKNLKN